MEFFRNLFDTSDFPARWMCGSWSSGHGWLHILSDLGVWSAYFTIPVVLGYFLARRKDLPFRAIFLLFAAFILLCGLTHLMEAIIFWWPAYRLAGVLKLLTAVVSWITVFALIRVAPTVLAMRTPEELEREIVARKDAERRLQEANAELERRVDERTAELGRSVAALEGERERLRTTLASIGDAVITTDVEGRIGNMNSVAESLTGWVNADAVGQPLDTVFNIVNEETRRAVENPATKALKEGIIVGLANHTVLIAKDGTERPIDDSAAPIRCKEGEIVGCVLVFRDITERHRQESELRDRERQFRTLAESIPQLAWMANSDGHIFWYNRRWYDYTGTTPEQMEGWGWQSVHDPDQLPAVLERWKASIATGQPLDMVFPLKGGDGVFRPFLTRVEPVKDNEGRVVRWFGTNTDVTETVQAEERLRFQLNLTKNITDNATTAIFMMDDKSRCTFMNPAAERMTGFSFGEVEGGILHDFIHHHRPDGRHYPMQECPLDRALPEGGEVRDHEDLFFRKDGTPFTVVCNARVIYKEGVAVGTVIEVRDTTKEREAAAALRERELRYRLVGQAANDAIWDWDLLTNRVTWSDGVRRAFGFTAEQVGPETAWWVDHIHPDDRDRITHDIHSVIDGAGESWSAEYRFRRADGSYATVFDRGRVVREGGRPVRMVGSMLDLTLRKRLEDKLRQVAAELSVANQRKDEFLATLAHELRNPLAPIRNGLQVIKLAGNDSGVVERSINMMERQVEQMVRLVDDLMDVSRINQAKIALKRERVELAKVIDGAIETSRPLIEEYNHELTVTKPRNPVILDADLTRLAQVFSNLLNNAGKYTERGGHISLRAEQQGSDVVVSVSDTGIGIAADKLPTIFGMFSQVEGALSRSQGGLGIGLFLVKRLVEMHGGTIEAHSEGLGAGSEFVVRLPVVVEQASNRQPSDEPNSTPISDLRILVVDDNRDAASSLAMLLKMMGNNVHVAHDGEKAVPAANEFRPHVALLDIGLPKMNGYEVARAIRQQPGGEQIILIAVTGWGQDSDRQKSKDAGFDHHMVKPVDPKSLMNLLAELDLVKKPSHSPEKPRTPGPFLRVLVVDDSRDARHMLGTLLKAYGHDILTASDGPTALKAAVESRPEVVLLDINLPGMNGLEVAKRIREQPTLKEIVLIALTGHGEEADRQRSREAGFDYHLVKPCDIKQVQEILTSIKAS